MTHKRSTRMLLMLTLFIVAAFLSFPQTMSAAQEGTMMSNAKIITFGETYKKDWGRNTDHLNHYCKITVPVRGTITIQATKPYDDEGEYGKMLFSLYDEDGEIIWDYGCSKSQDDARDFYQMRRGLNSGVYYLTILPKFTVISGNIESNYSVNFKADPNCEIEPNNSLAQATPLKLGTVTAGYYGYDFGSAARNDYLKINLTAGKCYKIAIGNYAKVESTSTILDLITPNGDEKYIKRDMANLVDDEGMNYILYTPPLSGNYYICFENYSGIQYNYSVRVSEFQKRTQKITGLKSEYLLSLSKNTYKLYPKAVGKISVSSSNTNVVDTYYWSTDSYITLYPYKVGKATITVTADAVGLYEKAVYRFKVIVKPPKAKLISVKNKKGMVMDVTWSWKDHDKIDGYQMQVSTKKNFKSAVKTYNSSRKYSGFLLYKSNGLKKKKTYYVRVRTYKKVSGSILYSGWSNVKKVKMKK